MNKTYMLDTNICSFILREQPEAVIRRLEQTVLAWDRAAVDATTNIKAVLAAAGTPIGPNNTAIAAGAILVTNNTREFERVTNLILEDWVK